FHDIFFLNSPRDPPKLRLEAIAPGARQLLEYLKHVYDEVVAVARVGQTVERHAIRRHHLLRIGNEIIHRLGRPGNAAAFERRRVAKIVTLPRSSPEDPTETGPHFVSCTISRMAGAAFLEDFLAAFRIALRVRHAGWQDKRRHQRSEKLETSH